ncbi:luciferin 4-monooxygenase-like [Plodia interpunctella]|uniref:luciferin 4-monooxygenase-like n=1 Tax=Plodia interpunctella TaxID=58824 RepID=UPI00236750C1|nr:luciferin 4-monooxygenase-like [Plodia interpunctella]
MHARPRRNASIYLFLDDLTSRVVARSGIPSDRHHIGKLIQQSLRDDPNFILQIDASTDTRETSGSVLRRSTQFAIAMNNFGIKCGDVIGLVVPNRREVCIVMYAALYLGAAVACLDVNMGINEMQEVLDNVKPQIVFSMNDYIKTVGESVTRAKLSSEIVTLDANDDHLDIETFLRKFGDVSKVDVFKPTEFDPSQTISFLMMTSGTTGGAVKFAALSHASILYGCVDIWSRQHKFPDPERMALILSPLQWVSAIFHYVLSPVLRYTRLQSPLRLDKPYIYTMINKYRPTHMICSPPLMASLLNMDDTNSCDLSCFNYIVVGGSYVSPALLKAIQKTVPNTDVQVLYGQTEMSGMIVSADDKPIESVGRLIETVQFRLIDHNTHEDIVEPNKTGELWVKGPGLFKGYYNDPGRTKETFSDDGWFKTGDLLYMDEHRYLYFVDRLKMLLKYKNHHVSPVEIENVIQQHPGVYQVAVTGIVEDLESGDLPVACVVRRPGHDVTTLEIKELVKNSLSDTKQLRGGVIFMDQLPMTASSKINRSLLKKIVTELTKE